MAEPGPPIAAADITGLVLAGGMGRRMGGADKGLQLFLGRPLAAHAVERLAPQVGPLLISANRNHGEYRRVGMQALADAPGHRRLEVVADALPEHGGLPAAAVAAPRYDGPLAGIAAGLAAARTPWLACVPCDSPLLPPDLVARLAAAATAHGAQLAVARCSQGRHPVFALMSAAVAPSLRAFLAAGGRRVRAWQDTLRTVEVDFGDAGHAFDNANTAAELRELATLAERGPARACGPRQDGSAPSPRRQNTALTVDEARAALLSGIVPVDEVERVPAAAALGRILAADLVSPIDVPAQDNAAMDGYALRGADLAPGRDAEATVIGTALAGHPYAGPVGPGQAVRIMTGAVMPDGCDTVAAQETVRRDGDRIVVPADVRAGQNRRLRGEDLRAGQVALRAGRRLSPADIGVSASLGAPALTVRRRLRVAVFSTGDELLLPGDPPRPGAIHDSNRPALLAALQDLGADTIDMGVLRDVPDALEAALVEAAGRADAVLTSGGVSVGDADFVRDVLARRGRIDFWKVEMKPGRPLAFGRLYPAGPDRAGAYLFGLPGNPVAALVSFQVMVRPALLKLAGAADAPPAFIAARCTRTLRRKPGREEYLRAVAAPGADGMLEATPVAGQGSAMLFSLSQANCLLRLPAGHGDVAAGERLQILLLDSLR
ncbi:hypothetical protein GCM10023144_14890 [Pigmentiphaga soli]|uniref:Molybdenum cofactor guanylyltransferase n=1 Tax=Pigmentiphaga soli TaxID=1007095 RepID=A0ABP8GR99_9BURK